MSESARIWLTRPAADSARLAARLQSHPTLIAPMITIEPIDAPLPDMPDAVLLTSRHAAEYLAHTPAAWRKLPVYCVGQATASAACAQGFTLTHADSGDVMSLLVPLRQLPPGSRILYLSGTERRVDISAQLSAQAIAVQVLEVYRAAALTSLGQPAAKALAAGGIGGVVFFSPRSAKIGCQLMIQAGLADEAKRIDAFCLSESVAGAAQLLPWRSLHICAIPTTQSMIELIASQRRTHMV